MTRTPPFGIGRWRASSPSAPPAASSAAPALAAGRGRGRCGRACSTALPNTPGRSAPRSCPPWSGRIGGGRGRRRRGHGGERRSSRGVSRSVYLRGGAAEGYSVLVPESALRPGGERRGGARRDAAGGRGCRYGRCRPQPRRPMANPYLKQYLMTAGPTPLPPAVSQVMAEPMLYHRAPAFIEVYARALERLRLVFQTPNDVLMFAASGTGGMESSVANLIRPGSRRSCPAASSGSAGPSSVRRLRRGHGPPRGRLGQQGRAGGPGPAARRGPGRRGGVHDPLETSTGVVNDVQALAEVAHRHGALMAVDAVSAASGRSRLPRTTGAWTWWPRARRRR